MEFNLVATISIIIGLIACFFGFSLRKIVVVIAWILMGYTISKGILINYVDEKELLEGMSIIIGLILGVVSHELELISIFVAAGFLCGNFAYQNLTLNSPVNIIIAVIVGIIAGALSIKLVKPILIIATAIAGGGAISSGLATMFKGIPNYGILIIEIVFITLGILFQFKGNKGEN